MIEELRYKDNSPSRRDDIKIDFNKTLSKKQRDIIDKALEKVILEYGEALRLLGES